MSPAERIIDRFGGISPLARLLGHKHASTVQGWKDRGRIPVWQIPEVMELAEREGIALDWKDFLEGAS